MKIIGLTGQSGSGKSLAANILKEHGAYIIDADKIAHEVLLPGGLAYEEVISNLGCGILDDDNFINRKKVAQIVFNDPEQLKRHVEATHKHIINKMHEEINAAINYRIICLDAPLLTESGMHLICDEVWAIYADEAIRAKRIMKRDNLSAKEAERRFAAQSSFEKIAQYADIIINNNSSPEEFAYEVKKRIAE